MKNIKKALVQIKDDSLEISLVKMNTHIPINRYIDKTGFYNIDVITTPNHQYLITFLKEEINTDKTKFLLTKIDTDNHQISMTFDDLEEIKALSYTLTGVSPPLIQ